MFQLVMTPRDHNDLVNQVVKGGIHHGILAAIGSFASELAKIPMTAMQDRSIACQLAEIFNEITDESFDDIAQLLGMAEINVGDSVFDVTWRFVGPMMYDDFVNLNGTLMLDKDALRSLKSIVKENNQ